MSYLSKMSQMLADLEETAHANIEEMSEQLAHVIIKGGIIHLFGSGHSNLIAQDSFYRAGGLAPVHAINVEPFMLHTGAEQSSENERKHGVIQEYLQSEDIRDNDAVVIISTSGRNPVPIDAARFAKEKGAFVIGMLSELYRSSQKSKHLSGYRLEDVVDMTLNTNVPVGDVIMSHDDIDENFSPVSSVMGIALLQEVFSRTIVKLKEKGVHPPILRSGNVDGAEDHNKALLERYRHRIAF